MKCAKRTKIQSKIRRTTNIDSRQCLCNVYAINELLDLRPICVMLTNYNMFNTMSKVKIKLSPIIKFINIWTGSCGGLRESWYIHSIFFLLSKETKQNYWINSYQMVIQQMHEIHSTQCSLSNQLSWKRSKNIIEISCRTRFNNFPFEIFDSHCFADLACFRSCRSDQNSAQHAALHKLLVFPETISCLLQIMQGVSFS